MKSWTTGDYFTITQDNAFPGGSPNVEFTCKKCGYVFQERCYGTFHNNEKNGYDIAEEKQTEHIIKYHLNAES